jgi:hypothetical protein
MPKPEDVENQVLVEEMLKAKAAPEPMDSLKDRVVHDGNDDVLPAPMTMSTIKSAGYVFVYDMETGDRSIVNANMLPSQLRKMRNGKRVFTTQKPTIEPKRGILQCFLHPDNPNREHYTEMGLPVCKKSNLINEYQRTRHMQRKHKDEWASIEAERKTKEEKDIVGILKRTFSKGEK